MPCAECGKDVYLTDGYVTDDYGNRYHEECWPGGKKGATLKILKAE